MLVFCQAPVTSALRNKASTVLWISPIIPIVICPSGVLCHGAVCPSRNLFPCNISKFYSYQFESWTFEHVYSFPTGPLECLIFGLWPLNFRVTEVTKVKFCLSMVAPKVFGLSTWNLLGPLVQDRPGAYLLDVLNFGVSEKRSKITFGTITPRLTVINCYTYDGEEVHNPC